MTDESKFPWPTEPPTLDYFLGYCAEMGMFEVGRCRGISGSERVAEHIGAIISMQHHHDLYMILSAVREIDPNLAEKLAQRSWLAAEAGDSYGEWLWEWATAHRVDADAVYEFGVEAGKEVDR